MPAGRCVIRYDGARGVVWRVKYADADGRQVVETIGAERDGVTRKYAEAELRERLVCVERQGYRRPKPLTFGEYAETWFEAGKRSQGWKPRTLLVYRNAIDGYLEPWFGSTRLDAIRPRDVTAFITDAMTKPHGKHKRPLSGKYVNLLLNIAYSVFKSAIGEELVASNPVASVRRPKVERGRWRILEPVEVPRVHKAFSDDRGRRVFLTLALTGLRRSEVIALRWRNVNLVEGTLRVVESKSEEGERLIGLSPALVDTLAAAGITDRVRPFHDMRRTALTNLAATGASPIAVMVTAGHRSMQTTKGYLHLAGVVFHDDASALERRLLGVEGSGRNEPETASLGASG